MLENPTSEVSTPEGSFNKKENSQKRRALTKKNPNNNVSLWMGQSKTTSRTHFVLATEEQVRLIRVIAGRRAANKRRSWCATTKGKNPHSSARHGSVKDETDFHLVVFFNRRAERERQFEAFCPSWPSLTQAHPLHFHLLARQRAKVL